MINPMKWLWHNSKPVKNIIKEKVELENAKKQQIIDKANFWIAYGNLQGAIQEFERFGYKVEIKVIEKKEDLSDEQFG